MADQFDANAAVRSFLAGTAPTPETALRTTLYDAVGQEPDYEADLRRVAAATGVPIDTARAMPDALRQQAALQSIDTSALARMNPVTTAFLTDPTNAAIAHDDTGSLASIEALMGSLGRGAVAGAKYIASSEGSGGLLRDIGAGVFRANRGAAGVFQAGAELMAPAVQPLASVAGMANPYTEVANWFGQAGAQSEAQAKALSPAGQSMVGNAVSSGVQSLTANILALPMALLPGGQGAALSMLAGSQGGQSYQQAREQGLPMGQALPFAASQAAIEYATEKLPMHLLLKDLQAGTPLGKTILHNAMREVPGEQIATALQDLNEWAVLPENKSKPFSAYWEERPSAAVQTLIATMIGVGGQVSVMQAIQTAADNAAGIQRKAEEAEQAASTVDALKAATDGSKLRERDPATFQAFVDEVSQNGQAPAEMYIDAQTLANTLNQSGVTMDQLRAMSEAVAEQMQPENLVPGADIRVPVADLLKAPSELTAPLVDHLRETPESMSRIEAQQFMAQQGDRIRQEVETELSRRDQAAAREQQVSEVAQQFATQLDTAGKFRPEVNRAYADVLGNFVVTQAERAGLTPQEFQQRYRLGVQAVEPVGGQRLDQGGEMNAPTAAAMARWRTALAAADNPQSVLQLATPTVLRQMGQAQASTEFSARRMAAVANAHPDIPSSVIENLPALLSDPLFAMPGREGGVDVVLDATSTAGSPILVNVRDGRVTTVTPIDPTGDRSADQRLAERLGINLSKQGAKVYARDKKALDHARAFGATAPAGAPDGLKPFGRDSHSGAKVIYRGQLVKKHGTEFYQGARGALSFGEDITQSASVIALLEGADLSTFIHESGHWFLEVQADLAARIAGRQADGDTLTTGEQQILTDMETVLEWFGVKPTPEQSALTTWLSMPLEEKREMHEQFARGFERYAMEGQAPTLALQQAFQRFRAWLVSIYKTLTGLNVSLTDDVRAVFGRMLASDQAIQEAQDARAMGPLFQTPEQAGMTPEEFADYQALGAQATADASEQVEQRMLKDLKWLSRARAKAIRSRQLEVAGIRDGIRNEISRDVWAQPVYQAWQFLTGKGEKVLPGTRNAEDVDTVLESGRLRTSLVKELDESSAETLIRRRMTSEKEGLHPDIVAEMFGYRSGQELIAALATAESPTDLIDQMTDQRTLEEHGDISSPQELERAADEAVHNELRARVIASELKALQKASTTRESSDSLYRGGSVDVLAKAAKTYADGVVGRIKLKDLRPKQYAAAEARSAKLATQALGNTAEAAMHKRNQLVNNLAAKAAYEAQDEITKADAFFRRVLKGNAETVGKTRDWATVQAARAVLAEFGIGTRGEKANAYLDSIPAEDGMRQVLAERIAQIASNAKPVKEMTVDEFRTLEEEVRGLWHMAKRSRQIEIDGEMMDRAAVQADLLARMTDIGIPERVAGEGKAVTDAERRLSRLQTLGAALRRVESWAGAKDGSKGIGPFRRYIFQPVKEAADRYRADKAVYIKQYKALLETLDLGKARIDAPELGYTFGYSRGGAGKAEILHAILHTGNASNKRKLLLGRGWAVENQTTGELDTSRWDAFEQRMQREGVLTKKDYDFAQGVWDLLESTKGLAQRAHRDVFGYQFSEVTADAFENQFGSYRGGYVPAMMDPEVVKDAATRALQEDENQTLAYAFPSTSKGFTKARVEHNRPLLLDLRTLSTHIDKVLLFSHMEAPVRDVRRVLASREVSEPLHRIDPAAFDGLLTPWLNRAARQTVETRVPGDNGTLRFFSKLRQRAGLAAMFANVSNTAQQITGFSIAALKVRPKHLLDGIATYLMAPRQTARSVAEASIYMANRMDSEVANMTDAINDILLNPSVYEKAQSWTARHAYFMQSAVDNVMGPIIWTGAYNQALEQGHSSADAVRLADSAVRETQGSTLAEDVSRIETGNAFVRMFTQFAGYFNMQANLLGTEFANVMHEQGLRKGMGRGLYVFTLGFLVPNMIAELIAQAFKGGPDDEDKDGSTLDDWLMAVVVMGNVKAGLAMVPGVGQAANALINTFNKKPYDDRITTSPAVSMIESAAAAPHSVYQAVMNEGSARKAVRDLATLISLTTGLPATAVARPLGYAIGMSEDKIAPTSPVDAARGFVTGTPSPESKR